MRVLLLFAPAYLNQLYGEPPLGVSYLAQILKNSGDIVKCINLNNYFSLADTSNDILHQTRAMIEEFNPEILGINSWTYALPFSLELITTLRVHKKKYPIILSGNNAYFMPDETTKLVGNQAIVCTKKGYDEIANTYFGKNIALLKPTDLPLLDFSYFDDRRGRFYLLNKFGCAKRCSFCSEGMYWRTEHAFDVFHTLKQIQLLQSLYHIRDINFWDDHITMDWKYGKKFCEEILAQKITISWLTYSRIDQITEEKIILMKKAGCSHIFIGVESLNPKTLLYFNKTIEPDQYINQTQKVVRLLEKYKIQGIFSFILGSPVETSAEMLQEYQKIISLQCNNPGIRIELSQLTPEIDSLLWKMYQLGKTNLWKIQHQNLLDRFAGTQLFSEKYDEPWLVPQKYLFASQVMNQKEFELTLSQIWELNEHENHEIISI